MAPVYPRSTSNAEHDEVAAMLDEQRGRDIVLAELRHDVATLKSEAARHEAATWRRIGILQWVISGILAVVLGVGGGLLDKAYDAYGLLADRVIEVDQAGEKRVTEVTEKLTTAINSLTNQVVRLDERLSAMSARLSELDSRRASGVGSAPAGSRPEPGERGTW